MKVCDLKGVFSNSAQVSLYRVYMDQSDPLAEFDFEFLFKGDFKDIPDHMYDFNIFTICNDCSDKSFICIYVTFLYLQ